MTIGKGVFEHWLARCFLTFEQAPEKKSSLALFSWVRNGKVWRDAFAESSLEICQLLTRERRCQISLKHQPSVDRHLDNFLVHPL